MSRKRVTLGQGSIDLRNGWWWCNYVAGGVRRRESCKTKNREEALAFLHRRQGKLASGEYLTPNARRFATCFSSYSRTTTSGELLKLTSQTSKSSRS